MAKRVLGVTGLLTLGLLLTSCATNDLARQYEEGSNKGYIAGDGSVTEIPADKRAESIGFGGVTEDGTQFDSADFDGQVMVVNFWYAGCAPCRAEAPQLQSLWETYATENVQFVGINVFDQPDTAISFNDTYGITYPSIIDVNSGAAKLAFTGTVPAKAVPTTLVLDKEGRVAARILGELPDQSILSALIREVNVGGKS
ncbi:TlpA family protein disulfide reductase [Mycetocola zhadangensis]|uniref:TlpA family protein disulfide reductase n=1 Tax=Mycetocola zhadangensis TaxID=1164595 RepID=UPI003A4E5F01